MIFIKVKIYFQSKTLTELIFQTTWQVWLPDTIWKLLFLSIWNFYMIDFDSKSWVGESEVHRLVISDNVLKPSTSDLQTSTDGLLEITKLDLLQDTKLHLTGELQR